MYIKGFTYVGFAVVFMRLGGLVTDMIGNNIDDLSVDHEQLVATTTSVREEAPAFRLPGVFIMIPFGEDDIFYQHGCYPQVNE